ncbi:signal sequence peptidase I [Pyrococcus furiosus DSM 3638]|uniref:Signal sequence peptidase I n=1 Tax=Pyrococcus furiosus (strain ATCC 43587 / DSM 3638 / JCM 8422 / Vc1) TaxID=186497 RepID=Q8U3Y8_PYRFU|nr:signal sequence peptidase I [Pyrococcus furiosus DSM 3638]
MYENPLYKYPIIHRVREIKTISIEGREELCFVTWGDNNPVPDVYPTPYGMLDCVPGEAIKAKALVVFPRIGIISIKVREFLGIGG